MNAVENLIYLKNIKGLTYNQIADIAGISPRTLRGAAYGYSNLGNQMIFKLTTFDRSFEKYLEKKACVICGAEFIPVRAGHATCSDKCSDLNRKKENKRYMMEYHQRKKNGSGAVQVEHETLPDYNEKARREFGSYGQRSAAERLAQSISMRESMKLGAESAIRGRKWEKRV